MKIAVTGASGFIGKYVLTELRKHNLSVVAATRSASRLTEFQGVVEVLEMDIGEAGADIYSKLGEPDVVVHLAWDGLPNYKSLNHFESELPKQYRFLKLLVEERLSTLLVTGTCFEYGMQSGALSETLIPQPTIPYGFAKDTLRRQLEFLRGAHPFNLVWARLFYMYGKGQPATSLYSQIKAAVASGDRVFNMSGGEQLRDYLPVEEVARLLVRLALLQADIGIVNVCSGKPVSVRRLVEGWVRENHWNIKLNFGYHPYPDYEPMAFWGDRYRLKTVLGKE